MHLTKHKPVKGGDSCEMYFIASLLLVIMIWMNKVLTVISAYSNQLGFRL